VEFSTHSIMSLFKKCTILEHQILDFWVRNIQPIVIKTEKTGKR
jgi:hypothetical protein